MELFGNTNVNDLNWSFSAVKTEYAWNYECFGNEVKVGIIDSGLCVHPYLNDNCYEGYNIIDYSNDITDNLGHGTFVSGIVCCNQNNNEYVQGIAPKAQIVPIKCFDINYSTKVDKIAEAIKYAVDVYKCDIINMSFGLKSNSQYLKDTIEYALQNGVILVAAVGNSGGSSLNYPAAYEGVIGVGAVDQNLIHCDYSQHNNSVDVVAPGKGIHSIMINGFTENSGTSFAAPHVSAAAAIALCIDDSLTPQKFMELLSNTSVDFGYKGYDEYYGYGLLDIEELSNTLIMQNDFFMSPINVNVEKTTVTICNNTKNIIDAVLINAEYLNGKPDRYDFQTVTLPSHSKKNIQISYQNNDMKMFLWNNFNLLTPLCKNRQHLN